MKFIAAVVFAGLGVGSPLYAQQSSPVTEIVEMWLSSGHGNPESPSFTHWDADGEIPQTCAVCHSGQGFQEFYGLDGSAVGEIAHPIPVGGVIDCATCHDDGVEDIAAVTFPSGVEVEPLSSTATCMTCHQGRQSGDSVAQATEDMPEDTINAELAFINPHYSPAAATLYGDEVRGGYQYSGRSYMGRFAHVPPFSSCADCHDPHSLEVAVETCVGCHQAEDLRAIRTSEQDFDGDGDTSSGIFYEIEAMTATLLESIEAYAQDVVGTPIVYADRFPYFFLGEEELVPANRYNAWTPRLLRAAYNYQFVSKDKGAYSHNPHYAVQLLHDSIESLEERVERGVELGERP